MPEPIPATEVETLVGIQRHATDHYARSDSKARRTYVLHSKECLSEADDLPAADCVFSAAQDLGIDEVASEWEGCEDQPLKVELDDDGYMVPAYVEIPEERRFAPGTRVKVKRGAIDPGDGHPGGEYVIEAYVDAEQRDHPLPYYMVDSVDADGLLGGCIPHEALEQTMTAAEHTEAMKMPGAEEIASAISSALHSMFSGDEISVYESQVLKTPPDPTDRGPGFEGEHHYTHGVEFYGRTDGGRRFGAVIRLTALWDTD